MTQIRRIPRTLAALLLVPLAACSGTDKTNTVYVTPPAVDPCAQRVNATQPTLGFAPAKPVGTGGAAYTYDHDANSATSAIEVPYVQKRAIAADGLQFRDLNANGTLEKYEDWRYSDLCRAKDLVGRMTLAQKIGLMSEGSTIGSGSSDGVLPQNAINSLAYDLRRQALIRPSASMTPAQYATYLNNVQAVCEGMPLGIPFALTTDPAHFVRQSTNATTGVQTLSTPANFSCWPTAFGLAAINDVDLTFRYGDTVRREFKAQGFRWQLGPMADLATEPRWERVQNTFGENATLVAMHVKSVIEGFQAGREGGLRGGIAATMKHFPGAGADQDGMDSHSSPGRYNVYPGGLFEYHSIPFKAAIDAGVAAVMPCYSIFRDLTHDPEQVGAAHSRTLITEYLKAELGFDGMITGDWGAAGGSAWGLEFLTAAEKAASYVKAGSHQLGSDAASNVLAAYNQKLLTDADIDGAAAKILEMSFKLGLFENPYTDVAAAGGIVRSQELMLAGFEAQKKAIVLLKNSGMIPAGRNTPATCATSGATVNAACLPINPARYADLNANGLPDADEFVADANSNARIEVYYDGVTDGLAGSDPYSTWLLDYAYSTAGAGTPGAAGYTLPVVEAASAATADLAILRITARKGTYFGLDAGVPLSFDGPFPGTSTDGNLAAAVKDAHKVVDLFRIRDGYTDSTGTVHPAVNPGLKIVLVVNLDRAAILRPFVNGLRTLDETAGVAGSYPLVSLEANINPTVVTAATAGPTAHVGADTIVADFGAYDRAVLDFLFARNPIAGWSYGAARLPMELPSSDAAVEAQYEDVPADSVNPTYAIGSGANLPAN